MPSPSGPTKGLIKVRKIIKILLYLDLIYTYILTFLKIYKFFFNFYFVNNHILAISAC